MVQEISPKVKQKPKRKAQAVRLRLLKGKAEQHALRRYEAFRLRAGRFSYEEIGKKLGVDTSTAYDLVASYWKDVREITQDRADVLRAIENENLDQMEKEWLPVALRKECSYRELNEGEEILPCDKLALSALDRVLKIMERRAKINGTDLQPELPQNFVMTQDLFHQFLTQQINGTQPSIEGMKTAKPVLELTSGVEGMDTP